MDATAAELTEQDGGRYFAERRLLVDWIGTRPSAP